MKLMLPDQYESIRTVLSNQRLQIMALRSHVATQQDETLDLTETLDKLWNLTEKFDQFFRFGLETEGEVKHRLVEVNELERIFDLK